MQFLYIFPYKIRLLLNWHNFLVFFFLLFLETKWKSPRGLLSADYAKLRHNEIENHLALSIHQLHLINLDGFNFFPIIHVNGVAPQALNAPTLETSMIELYLGVNSLWLGGHQTQTAWSSGWIWREQRARSS